MIDAARELAKELHRPAAVLTFEPHPRSFFKPDTPLFRLTPEGIKAKLLARFGLQAMIVLPFDVAMASTTAEHFINDILFRELNVAGVVVGHDFHFGRGRGGTPHSIAEACRQDGRAALIIEALLEKGAAVSSSAVRAALADGDMPRANHLLGYRYLFEAEVRHGEKIGRTLGYPTANLRLPENSVLKQGIYAVRVAVGEKSITGSQAMAAVRLSTMARRFSKFSSSILPAIFMARRSKWNALPCNAARSNSTASSL